MFFVNARIYKSLVAKEYRKSHGIRGREVYKVKIYNDITKPFAIFRLLYSRHILARIFLSANITRVTLFLFPLNVYSRREKWEGFCESSLGLPRRREEKSEFSWRNEILIAQRVAGLRAAMKVF